MNFLGQLFQLLQFNLDFEILFRFSYLIAVTISVLWIKSNAYHAFVSRTFGRIGLLVTGVIGVPIHEISHAFLARIFGHRINKIVFFQFKKMREHLVWSNTHITGKTLLALFASYLYHQLQY